MSAGVSIREALATLKSLTPLENALYAAKYTEVLEKHGPKQAVLAGAAHVLDHRQEIACLRDYVEQYR